MSLKAVKEGHNAFAVGCFAGEEYSSDEDQSNEVKEEQDFSSDLCKSDDDEILFCDSAFEDLEEAAFVDGDAHQGILKQRGDGSNCTGSEGEDLGSVVFEDTDAHQGVWKHRPVVSTSQAAASSIDFDDNGFLPNLEEYHENRWQETSSRDFEDDFGSNLYKLMSLRAGKSEAQSKILLPRPQPGPAQQPMHKRMTYSTTHSYVPAGWNESQSFRILQDIHLELRHERSDAGGCNAGGCNPVWCSCNATISNMPRCTSYDIEFWQTVEKNIHEGGSGHSVAGCAVAEWEANAVVETSAALIMTTSLSSPRMLDAQELLLSSLRFRESICSNHSKLMPLYEKFLHMSLYGSAMCASSGYIDEALKLLAVAKNFEATRTFETFVDLRALALTVSASCYGRKQKLCHAAKLLREAIALEGVPRRVHACSVIARVNLAAAMLQLNRFAASSH